MKNNEKTSQPKRRGDAPEQRPRGDARPKGINRIERQVKDFFSVFTSARDRAEKSEEMEKTISKLDYRLAQRLDSAGYPDLAVQIPELSEKQPGFFARFWAGFRTRPLGQRLAVGAGGFMSVVILFGFTAFALVWFRGTDVPVLRNLSEQSHPVLSLTKESETEYGVAIANNSFEIRPDDAVTFRSLGIANKVSIVPDVDIDVELSSDHTALQVTPLESLHPDTEYTLVVREGTMFSDGTSLSADYEWVFRTEPEFLVTGITPRNGTESAPYDAAIEVEFTYKNVNPETFSKYFEIVPPVEGTFEMHGKKMVFLPEDDLVGRSVYRVIVKKGLPNARGDTLPRNYESVFKVSSTSSDGAYLDNPEMYWSDQGPIISTTQEPWLGISSYDVSGPIEFTLYSAGEDALLDVMKDFKWEIYEKPDPTNINKIREFTKTPAGARFLKVDLDDYGIYFLEAYNASYGRSIYKFLVYSPLGAVLSDAYGSDRVWLSDMNQKEPIGGGKVYFYDFDKADIPVHSTTTDSNGYALLDGGGAELVISTYSGNHTVLLSGRYTRSSMWWVGGWSQLDVEDYTHRAYVQMDKPLYRPGDTVYFKTILREEDDMSYGVPEGKLVTMRVGSSYYYWNHLRQLPYYEETFTVTKDYGTASGEFVIPSNMVPGHYSLNAFVDGVLAGTVSFTLAEYEKPRYMFEMRLDRTRAFSGETVEVEVTGTDYSGDPAAGAKIGLTVNRGEISPINWIEDAEEFERNQYSYYGSENLSDLTLTLDSEGRAVYTFKVDASTYGSNLGVYSAYIWSKENYVNHDSGSVVVADAEVMLYAKPDDWSVAEGGDNTVTFKTADLWDFVPEGGVKVEYRVERKWTEWVQDGQYYDPVTKSKKPVYTSKTNWETVWDDKEVTTDADGLATDELVDLPPGSYYLYATYYVGEEITRDLEDVFYVYEEPDEGWAGNLGWSSWSDKFEIYLDKESYEVGDTASITIKTPLEGKGVYMVYRGDVYDWRVLDYSAGLVMLEQDITEDMGPWVQICAWGIDEYSSSENSEIGISKQYLTNVYAHTCKQVTVSRDRGRLSIDVSSDKEVYEPGDTVRLDIQVSDSAGRGAEAELSIDVVDRALLDIVRSSYNYYDNDIYGSFYKDVRQVSTQSGSMYRYGYAGWAGGGGGGGGDVSTRSNFADVAFWDGRIRTNASGSAQVEFILPDDLTTWAAQVHAVTEDTWVGQATTEFIARKDVRLGAKIPNFLRTDDKWDMDLEAYNYSGVTVDGAVTVSCEGCVSEEFTQNLRLSAGTRKVFSVDIDPAEGAEEVTLTAKIVSGAETHDAVEWMIPVIPVGFARNDTLSVLLNEGQTDGRLRFFVPSGVDISNADLRVSVARSFVNEWALVPVDPSVSSSIELSSSIIHNSLFLKYYDEIQPVYARRDYQQKIRSAMDLLVENQSNNGGFGSFDYDAVNYEVSAYVGIALGRASEVGIDPEGGRIGNLQAYLRDGLDSNETSIDEKILAVYSLSVMQDSSVLPYALNLKNSADGFADSPLSVAHLMLALEELGSVGDAGDLISYLDASATYTMRSAVWEDADAPFRVLKSADYTTAIVYQALAPYESREITQFARTWLVENPVSIHGNSVDAVGIFYALTSGNIDNLSGRLGVNKVTVRVNGKDYNTFDVGGNANSIGKVDISIPPQYLRDGENTVEVERSGEGELYVIGDFSYYAPSIGGSQEFEVTRMIKDFETGQPVNNVSKGDVVMIRTTVTPDRDGYNMVVREFMPAGFEPVQYQLGGYDYQFYKKWWKWGEDRYVNRYGTITQSHVTFTEAVVEEDEVYVFEYPAVATYTGSFAGAGSQGYLLGFGDVGGMVVSPDITVSP